MKTICAWCGVTMVEGEGEYVSHGMCESCAAKLEVNLWMNAHLRPALKSAPNSVLAVLGRMKDELDRPNDVALSAISFAARMESGKRKKNKPLG